MIKRERERENIYFERFIITYYLLQLESIAMNFFFIFCCCSYKKNKERKSLLTISKSCSEIKHIY